MIYGLITARKGSVRLKNKNMPPIRGKPMAVIAVESSLECSFIDRTLISTDIEELAQMYSENNSVRVIKRPAELCGPDVSSADVIVHAVKETGMKYDDVIVLLQPTSPLRSTEDIEQAYRIFINSGRTVISAEKLKRENIAVVKDSIAYMEGNAELCIVNGAVYIFTVGDFSENNHIPVCFMPYYMPDASGIDIDDENDYNCAKLISESDFSIKRDTSKED